MMRSQHSCPAASIDEWKKHRSNALAQFLHDDAITGICHEPLRSVVNRTERCRIAVYKLTYCQVFLRHKNLIHLDPVV